MLALGQGWQGDVLDHGAQPEASQPSVATRTMCRGGMPGQQVHDGLFCGDGLADAAGSTQQVQATGAQSSRGWVVVQAAASRVDAGLGRVVPRWWGSSPRVHGVTSVVSCPSVVDMG